MNFMDFDERAECRNMEAQDMQAEFDRARMPLDFLKSVSRIMDGNTDTCEDCSGDGCIPHDCGGGCGGCHWLGAVKCGTCDGTGYAKPKEACHEIND